jgi:hypothetical protein
MQDVCAGCPWPPSPPGSPRPRPRRPCSSPPWAASSGRASGRSPWITRAICRRPAPGPRRTTKVTAGSAPQAAPCARPPGRRAPRRPGRAGRRRWSWNRHAARLLANILPCERIGPVAIEGHTVPLPPNGIRSYIPANSGLTSRSSSASTENTGSNGRSGHPPSRNFVWTGHCRAQCEGYDSTHEGGDRWRAGRIKRYVLSQLSAIFRQRWPGGDRLEKVGGSALFNSVTGSNHVT